MRPHFQSGSVPCDAGGNQIVGKTLIINQEKGGIAFADGVKRVMLGVFVVMSQKGVATGSNESGYVNLRGILAGPFQATRHTHTRERADN